MGALHEAVLALLSICLVQGNTNFELNGRQFDLVFDAKSVADAQAYCASTFGTELALVSYRPELDAVYQNVLAAYTAAETQLKEIWLGGRTDLPEHGRAEFLAISPEGNMCVIGSTWGTGSWDAGTFDLFNKPCGQGRPFLCATAPLRFKDDGQIYEIILNPKVNPGDARLWCEDQYGTTLAVINNRIQLEAITPKVRAQYQTVGEPLKELWLGSRAYGAHHGGVEFEDFNNEGDLCVIASVWGTGNWDAENFDIYLKMCHEVNPGRAFLCSSPTPQRFTVNDRYFQVVLGRRNAADANAYCQEKVGTELAVIRDENELKAVSQRVISVFDSIDVTLKELLLAMHTNVPTHGLVQFDQLTDSGNCVIGSVYESGGWVFPNLRLFSKVCTEARQFLCATPPPVVLTPTTTPAPTPPPVTLPPGTEHDFSAGGKDYTAYLVDPEHTVNSQAGANGYCESRGKRLAQVRSQAKLDVVSDALMEIRSAAGHNLGEIVTGERVSARPDIMVDIDRMNPAGWACATLVEDSGRFSLFAKRCAQQRGVLCEEIPSC